MTYEDLTTFTKVDPLGNITLTNTHVIVSELERSRNAYVYKDYGVANFYKDFEHDIVIDGSVKDTLIGTTAQIFIWFLSNNLGTVKTHTDNNYNFIGLRLERVDSYTSKIRLVEYYNGTWYQSVTYEPINRYWKHWLTIDRIGSTLRVRIYGNSDRTDLDGTLTLTLNSVVNYRYLYLCCNKGSAGAVTSYASYSVGYLELVYQQKRVAGLGGSRRVGLRFMGR